MKRYYASLFASLFIGGMFQPSAHAQDTPGLSVGGFVERRTDNKINGDELSFNYYGIRLKARDERFFDGFVDLGLQPMDFGSYNANEAGSFGLGGTLWLLRAEDVVIPLDIGIYGSYHIADYTLKDAAGHQTDAKYGRYMAQVVFRTEGYGEVRPYLRAGVLGSKLDPDDDSVISSKDLDQIEPAVNVGFEISLGEKAVISVEGNYSQSVGGAVHLDYWF